MPSRITRPKKKNLPPWQPSSSTRRILEYLLEYRYLTSEMLAYIYETEHKQGRAYVQKQLTRLWRYGFAERFYRPTDKPGWGSSQYVYTLSVDGAHLAIDPEDYDDERRKVYNRAQPKATYEHPLAVALLQILWNLGSPAQDGLFTTRTLWQDKEGTGKETWNHFEAPVGEEGAAVSVEPDMTVLIAHQEREFYRPYFFEVERTTKNHERRRRRFRAYEHLLSKAGATHVGQVFKKHIDLAEHWPAAGMAVFVAADAHDAELQRRLALRTVPHDTELWFTSLDRLLESKQRRAPDGRLRLGRNNQPLEVEVPIPAAEFFTRDILTALDGKRGRLVV
jgi:hypothetical protein